MFDVVGSAPYLAPEYFSDDGYGEEVDIWAVGVLLYYLLFHNYPFKFKGQEENCYRDEFNLKCG
jgi:serine/threonine protein kinase